MTTETVNKSLVIINMPANNEQPMETLLPRDVIPQEEILQYVSPALLKLDYQDKQTQLYVIIAAFWFFFSIFVTSYILSYICFNFFRSMALKHKVFMSLAVVRSVYGIIGTVFGAYAIFWKTNLERDVITGSTATSSVAMLVTVGFFIFELGSVLMSDWAFNTFSKLLITHHGMGLIAYIYAVVNNTSFSFGCKALVLEMSTPFSCLCFVLLKAGLENSLAWKINQMVLVHTFHVRSIVECYMWYLTYQHWDNIWANMPPVMFALLYTNLVLVTFTMTPYWGYKKTQQLFNPMDWNFHDAASTKVINNTPYIKVTGFETGKDKNL